MPSHGHCLFFCVLEGSLAGTFARHHLPLELACGANFACNLMCWAGPGDLGESRVSAGRKFKEHWAKK